MRDRNANAHAREHIAQEAARIMIEGGIQDFALAKRKAMERLRLGDVRALPRNDEIERAIHDYQRLFRSDEQPRRLGELRRSALEAMRFLDRFRPKLVGPVLSGTADEHSDVVLHLFADPAEEVGMFLMERGIRAEEGERRMRTSSPEPARLPTYRFLAGEVGVELVVFSGRARRQQPLSAVDGRPMRRAGLAEVEALARDDA